MTSKASKVTKHWVCRLFHHFKSHYYQQTVFLFILVFTFFYQSLPVIFGIDSAKWICVSFIDITQISVVGMYGDIRNHLVFYLFFFWRGSGILISGYLLGASKPHHALALLVLLIPQVIFQVDIFVLFFTK